MERVMMSPAQMLCAMLLTITSTSAQAGPCTAKIAQLEATARNSATIAADQPTGRQAVAAQLGHQPTPASVARAQKHAQARFDRILARARILDAQGDAAGCARAVGRANLILNTP